jgi:hypothetical protein
MKYKIGDRAICKFELRADGTKRILSREPDKTSKIGQDNYLIAAINNDYYTIIIDDNMIGWNISKFHIKYQNIDDKLLNKKFYDVTEEMILGLAPKKKK